MSVANSTTSASAVPVSKRTLLRRVNKKLEGRNERIRAVRGNAVHTDLGLFCLVDVEHSFVIEKNVDLERYARKLGVLRPVEELVA